MILAIVLMAAAAGLCRAQEPTMEALLGQTLSKLQGNDPEAILNCIAELKRVEAMFPDEETPKFYIALQSLNYAVMNPHANQTETMVAEAEERIRLILSQLQDMQEDLPVYAKRLLTVPRYEDLMADVINAKGGKRIEQQKRD